MKKSDLEILYKFLIRCPFCGKTLNLADVDYDSSGEFSTPIFNNNLNILKGKNISCIRCMSDFEIGEIEI